jgi:hypothetical protein
LDVEYVSSLHLAVAPAGAVPPGAAEVDAGGVDFPGDVAAGADGDIAPVVPGEPVVVAF